MKDEKEIKKRKKYIPLRREYLHKARNKLKYSIEELSRKLDVSAVYYYQIEAGKRGRKLPVDLIIKLTEFLCIKADKFLNAEKAYMKEFDKLNEIKEKNMW